MSDAASRTSRPPTGVVSFWALDAPASINTIDEMEDVQRRLIEGVLSVVRALGASRSRLWIVTRGAQPAGGCVPSLVQAPLIGLGNVIAIEAPDLRCVRLDLDPVIRAGEADLLFDAIWHGDAEDRAALRDGIRYVARRFQAPSRRPWTSPASWKSPRAVSSTIFSTAELRAIRRGAARSSCVCTQPDSISGTSSMRSARIRATPARWQRVRGDRHRRR